jgi:ABC-type lipoprotein release transport system permease subunit
MNIQKLIIRELFHRKLNTLLSLFSVAAAVACLLGAIVLLRGFDRQTEVLVAARSAAVAAQMDKMEDDYRKITVRMGFNVLVLPHDQNLADFYAESFADKTMPEEYGQRLATATNIMTIRHVLPMLQQRLEWPEQKRKILLIGVQGRATASHQTGQTPLIKPVPAGCVSIGHELHHSLGITSNSAVVFMGKTFKVATLYPERGTIDDITLWLNLPEAQALLDRKGLINCIVALECECGQANLPLVRKEIEAVLPGTQVVELQGKALARAEARQTAAKNAQQMVEAEKQHRADLRHRHEEFAAVLVPLVMVACAVWVGLLAWINVRERRTEIGTLRALGLRQTQIAALFLGKAAILGLLGAAAGVLIGVQGAASLGGITGGLKDALALVGSQLALTVFLAAPVVTMLASWIPSLLAARQDPADVLREG